MQNLEFPMKGSSATGLTHIYEVRSAHTGVLLGEISWYARWRRYAFFPDGGSLFPMPNVFVKSRSF